MQIEDRVAVARDLRGVGFAMEHPERAAVALGALDRELAGGEGEQIGRERLRLGEARRASVRRVARASISAPLRDRLPAVGHVERQRPSRLEIRLVEAGERLVRARRHEDRVEEIVVAVERGAAGIEVERQAVLAGLERFRWR